MRMCLAQHEYFHCYCHFDIRQGDTHVHITSVWSMTGKFYSKNIEINRSRTMDFKKPNFMCGNFQMPNDLCEWLIRGKWERRRFLWSERKKLPKSWWSFHGFTPFVRFSLNMKNIIFRVIFCVRHNIRKTGSFPFPRNTHYSPPRISFGGSRVFRGITLLEKYDRDKYFRELIWWRKKSFAFHSFFIHVRLISHSLRPLRVRAKHFWILLHISISTANTRLRGQRPMEWEKIKKIKTKSHCTIYGPTCKIDMKSDLRHSQASKLYRDGVKCTVSVNFVHRSHARGNIWGERARTGKRARETNPTE